MHTAIRSKLGADKVRKTTIVGMDIKRSHLEAGLVCSRGHRKFSAPTSSDCLPETDTSDLDIGVLDDVLDFEQLAKQLIEDAAAEIDGDTDAEDDKRPPPPLTIRLPLHAIRGALPPDATMTTKTAIPLMSLFIFPGDQNSSPEVGIDYFWKGGIENLDKEMEACEALFASQEGDGEMDATASDSMMT